MKKIIATVLAMVMALALCTTAFAADLTVVHPVASIDDAWDDTADLLWTPRGESTLRKVLFVPVAALATPVVFAADNNYVPMLTTTIYSMLKNASKDRSYDVIVLERDIADENKRTMRQFFKQFPNGSRFRE